MDLLLMNMILVIHVSFVWNHCTKVKDLLPRKTQTKDSPLLHVILDEPLHTFNRCGFFG